MNDQVLIAILVGLLTAVGAYLQSVFKSMGKEREAKAEKALREAQGELEKNAKTVELDDPTWPSTQKVWSEMLERAMEESKEVRQEIEAAEESLKLANSTIGRLQNELELSRLQLNRTVDQLAMANLEIENYKAQIAQIRNNQN